PERQATLRPRGHRDRMHRIACQPPLHAFHGPARDIERSGWCPEAVVCSPLALLTTSGIRSGLANLSEGHPFAFFAGQCTLERTRTRMHPNGGAVAFDRVLQLVAGFDSQRSPNLPRNGCLPFTCYRGMQHGVLPYIAPTPCILIIPYSELNRKELTVMTRP